MTNIETNTIKGDTKVESQTRLYVDLPSEIHEEIDVSYASKKSRSFIFNKRLSAAPTVENSNLPTNDDIDKLIEEYKKCTTDAEKAAWLKNHSVDQLAAMYARMNKNKDAYKNQFIIDLAKDASNDVFTKIYDYFYNKKDANATSFLLDVLQLTYSNVSDDVRSILNKIISKTMIDIINSLSDKDKKDFLTLFAQKLQEICNSLPAGIDKNLLQSFILDLNKAIQSGKYTDPFRDDNFGNIMMFVVKAFNEAMNAEGLDQITQINDTKLINRFLQVANDILNQNMKDQKDLLNQIQNGNNSEAWAFWGSLIFTAVITFASFFVPEFGAAKAAVNLVPKQVVTETAEQAALKATEQVAVKATEQAVVKTGEQIGSDAVKTAGQTAQRSMTRVGKSATEVKPNEGVKPEEKTQSKAAKDEGKAAERVEDVKEGEGQTNGAQDKKTAQKEDPKKADQTIDSTDEPQTDEARADSQATTERTEMQQDADKTNNAEATKTAKKGKLERFQEWMGEQTNLGGKNSKILGKKFQRVARLKRAFKCLMYGAGAVAGEYFLLQTIDSKLVPHGSGNMSAVESAEISTFSTTAQYQNNVVAQNNTTQSSVSKRIGDDSEKISQDSGFVQQAINMFGTAFSFKV